MASFHDLQTRPIVEWPGTLTKNRKRARFNSGWGQTMNLLDSELQHLGARAIVFLMALSEDEIRIDGRPRASATPRHPGVILSFESKHGPLQYPCDTFDHWEDNVRAIALGLEALRKLDRYGISARGQQYSGWKALPAPKSEMNGSDVHALMTRILGGRFGKIPHDEAIREAEKLTHPDKGGNADDFKKVQEARKVLLG